MKTPKLTKSQARNFELLKKVGVYKQEWSYFVAKAGGKEKETYSKSAVGFHETALESLAKKGLISREQTYCQNESAPTELKNHKLVIPRGWFGIISSGSTTYKVI